MSGRVALVTGAASGIGRAISARLEEEAWRVLAVDVTPDPDGPGTPFAADLTSREANHAAVAAALERFGRLDAVIPNAGFQHVAPVEEFSEDVWEQLLALLVTSPFLLARYAWPALRAAGDGRIVVVASVHGLVASPFKAGYVAAKHGVLGLVKVLALEGADAGISVSAVCPGYVRTPLVESQIADQAKAHGLPEERVLADVLLAPQAIKELLEPDRVADAVWFLLGESGRFATGSALMLDAGWSAR
ncbi:MAG TPA: SDR family NAD(P)-dependent oxidoreductase [Gaiellaceae bacterium]|nr:SDR family NAD(P)-dependent oxidoreductase [Gaiellaceae bacterium]